MEAAWEDFNSGKNVFHRKYCGESMRKVLHNFNFINISDYCAGC
ncbi:hypothetical protein HMPREF9554_02970 [Treponema phagedenis F0421]|nr:hypothetical protein HMPREF9554_02970 [Treponema phagedenis F0421]